jgi:hypothetical protein
MDTRVKTDQVMGYGRYGPGDYPRHAERNSGAGVRCQRSSIRFLLSLLPVALILTALSACDNVDWGGTDIQIVPPPPAAGTIRIAPDAQSYAELGLPTGTVLFHLVRQQDQSRLIPVAEVAGDGLRALRRPAGVSPAAYEGRFREAVLPVGAQFDIFRRGARVGTFLVQGTGPVTPCGIPTATGSSTLVAAAADVGEFLAFRRGLSPEVRGEYVPPQVNGSIRTYASIVAERLVLQNGLPRPRSWPGAQRDLQAIEIMPGGNPEMATTYLVGDSLAVGPADERGYSVFYIADYETRRGYTPLYSEVHNYAEERKAAPRLVDHLNWDGQDGQEILIQVYGDKQSWYEMVGQNQRGQWTKMWEGARC